MSIQAKVEHLWNSAKSFQGDLQVHKLLKSYYINTCRKLAKNNFQIPKEKFSPSQMCSHCGTFWSESEYGLKLVSKEFKGSSKTRRLIEKFEQAKGTSSKTLNKSQKNRAKWLKKKTSHNMAIICGRCQNRSLLKMEKPKYKISKPLSLKQSSASDVKHVTQEYKNKKKSKMTSSTGETISISTSVPKDKSKKDNNKSTKLSKSKNNNINSGDSNKVISKTQKQNSLLQLAALLQKQTKVDSKNYAQKRLQSFLK